MGPRSARPALHPLSCGKPLGRDREHRLSCGQPTCRQSWRNTCRLKTVRTATPPTAVVHSIGVEGVRPVPLQPVLLRPVTLRSVTPRLITLRPITLGPTSFWSNAFRSNALRLIFGPPAQPFSGRCTLVQRPIAELTPADPRDACSCPSRISAPVAARDIVRPSIALSDLPLFLSLIHISEPTRPY